MKASQQQLDTTLFWDKNIAKSIPLALQLLRLPNAGTRYFLERYPASDQYQESGDDRWLSEIGRLGWFVMTQDWSMHTKQNELRAIRQHEIGCFYLWGARETKWSVLRCFAHQSDISQMESSAFINTPS